MDCGAVKAILLPDILPVPVTDRFVLPLTVIAEAATNEPLFTTLSAIIVTAPLPDCVLFAFIVTVDAVNVVEAAL